MPAELSFILSRSAIVIIGLMAIVWLESLRRRDASIVDLVWGLGFVVVAWTAFCSANSFSSDGKYDVILLPILTIVSSVCGSIICVIAKPHFASRQCELYRLFGTSPNDKR